MDNDALTTVLNDYIDKVNSGLADRVRTWTCSIADREQRDAIGGLMARQTSLATNFAANPGVWNSHIAPIFLRCMADLYITFCWIVKDPQVRCRQFIEYGLGQEKLALEKYKEQVLTDNTVEAGVRQLIETREKMLDMERRRFLIPVNLGSWSEMSTREMAKEIGEEAFYNYVFVQFSSAVHSTWQQIWPFNLRPCTNPLHGYHRVPSNPRLPSSFSFLMNAADYLCKVFYKFDCAMIRLDDIDHSYLTYNFLVEQLAEPREEGNGHIGSQSAQQTPPSNSSESTQ